MSISNSSIPIYKVNHLVGDKIDTIYVFYGQNAEITSVFEEVKRNPIINEFKDPLTDAIIFNEEELLVIRKNEEIKVIFSTQQIFSDDSIGAIKLKIVNEFGKTFSPEEIYMFCMKKEVLNAVKIYKSLTQNNKLTLTSTRLNQFLTNIIRGEDDNTINKIKKATYNYDDVLTLNISGKRWWVAKVLGQKFFIVDNEYPFVCNPFEVIEYDSFIERASRKSLTTLNSHVLLSNGEFIGNNIYLCLARDVLENAERKGLDELTTIKLYYPFLLKKHEIHSLSELIENEQILIDEANKLLNKSTIESFNSINLFYDMYKERKSELNYKNYGITSIRITLVPEYVIKIPLDIIFKLIHATEGNPLVKFNPATRRENIYRLYVDKISRDGRKIPFLSKAAIFKLMQNIGRGKSVSVYIQYSYGSRMFPIICEFEETGNIIISCDFDILMKDREIDDLFMKAVNPIIDDIRQYLQQSGYSMELFKSIYDESTIINYLNYQSIVEIDEIMKIKPLIGCISSAFIVESTDYKKGLELRYKRVSNFNKSTSQEAYVIEKQKQKVSEKEIIEGLIENYQLSASEALQLYARLASELQVERGLKGRDIEIKINPGFKVTMKVIHGTKNLKMDVENINDIYYLSNIPIFLDSLVRLTQDPESSNIPLKTIKLLCSKGEKKEVVLEDIISASEQASGEQEFPVIEGDDLEYMNMREYSETFANDKDKMKSALDLLYEEEEAEEDASLETSYNSEIIDSSGGASYGSNGGASSSSELESDGSLSSFGSLNSLKSGDIEGLDILASSESKSEPEKEPSGSSEPISIGDIEGLDILASSESKSEPEPEPETETETEPEPETETEPEPEPEKAPLEIIENIPEEPIAAASLPVENSLVSSIESEKIIIKPTKVSAKNKQSKEKTQMREEVLNIDGMKLANPTPFFKKMVERDPILFLTEDSDKFNSYSRTCLSSNRVQPVILNEEEKQKIDREMPGFLKEDDIVKYGSTPDKQNYYICPRYWCLKTNMPISPEDVAAGKCGSVIPRTEKKVPKGAYVYEFFNPSQHGTQSNYTQHYPGFVNDTKNQKHPNNLCIPCCYKDANSEIQKIMRKKCIKPEALEANAEAEAEAEDLEIPNAEKEREPTKKLEQEVGRVADKEEQYIQGPEKFPLDQGRWGYLPFQIQKFLHEVNADCQISKTNTNLKKNHPCLLRHGVISNNTQSFLACIADALLYDKSANISDLKDLIIRSLNIDNFLTFQNGNLVQSFANYSQKYITASASSMEDYKSSKLYKKIKEEDEDPVYFKQIISAFENFIGFIRNDEVVIDYTYLWDIISKPNPYLFKSGINLVILEITDNDSTNNISLVCPTNHYSNEFYEARKKTLILMKKVGKSGSYFEPIYSYEDDGNKIKIVRFFSEYDPQLSKTMRAVFKKLIKPVLQNKCLPLSSIPNQAEYKFKRPIELSLLVTALNNAKYEILMQVINYNSKVIGILAKNKKGKTGMVPCYPSSINPAYDYIFINDKGIFNSYEDTIDFLMTLYQDSRGKLSCKPDFKVVEDEVMIVGILTETNQFIELNPPEPLINIEDSIKIFGSNNYLVADKEIFSSNEGKVDEKRVDYITKLKLETNFLNVFRNTIRILLNEYENLSIREKIEELSNSIGELYNYKLKNIKKYLKELVKDKIHFSEDYNYNMVKEITTCIIQQADKCTANKPLCALINNGNTCQLVLPRYNLLNGADNKKIYFVKMADEIIRYNRIKSFIFKPQSYASFSSLNYNLRENEIIVIQSMLNQEYFEGLVPIEINKFIKYNTYDSVLPIKSQAYNHQYELDEAINPEESRDCTIKNNAMISSVFWRKTFPKKYGECEYDNSNMCSFYVIIDIVKKLRGTELSQIDIRMQLYGEYLKYLDEYESNIVSILIEEGKKTLGDQLRANLLKFQSLILSDSYFLTHFDLWLLLNKYKIPSFFVSIKKNIKYNNVKGLGNQSFLCYGEPSDKFVFIIVPAFAPEKVPTYRVINNIEDETEQISFSLDELKDSEGLDDLNLSLENSITVLDYLREFKKKVVPQNSKALKSKMKKLVLKEDNADVDIVANVDEVVVPQAEVEAEVEAEAEAEQQVPAVTTKKIVIKKKNAIEGDKETKRVKPKVVKEKKQDTRKANKTK